MESSNWRDTRDTLRSEWQQVLEKYVPHQANGSPWNFAGGAELPSQGWKLHVSASILNAGAVLHRIVGLLTDRGIPFKVPSSLEVLQALNAGLRGYSQIGKCITIYPRQGQVGELAKELDRLLVGFGAPCVPFDGHLRSGGIVHYRYGAILPSHSGQDAPTLTTPSGSVVPDDRYGAPYPDWVLDMPFEPEAEVKPAQFLSQVLCYRALGRRGRGSVFSAVDLRLGDGRPCIVKQGLRHGETDWAEIDGEHRIRFEAEALVELGAAGVPVPQLYGLEHLGANSYLVMEEIPGTNLQSTLSQDSKRPSLPAAIGLSAVIAAAVARVHQRGWIWGDCKPANIVWQGQQNVRLLDFEGSFKGLERDCPPWGTPLYLPPSHKDGDMATDLCVDKYALVLTVIQLIAGAAVQRPEELLQRREDVPDRLSDLLLVGFRSGGIAVTAQRLAQELLYQSTRT